LVVKIFICFSSRKKTQSFTSTLEFRYPNRGGVLVSKLVKLDKICSGSESLKGGLGFWIRIRAIKIWIPRRLGIQTGSQCIKSYFAVNYVQGKFDYCIGPRNNYCVLAKLQRKDFPQLQSSQIIVNIGNFGKWKLDVLLKRNFFSWTFSQPSFLLHSYIIPICNSCDFGKFEWGQFAMLYLSVEDNLLIYPHIRSLSQLFLCTVLNGLFLLVRREQRRWHSNRTLGSISPIF